MTQLAYSYIRMSSDLQLKGDSRRRQLEKSIEYAKTHGLRLADDAQLEDIGISAFKGANLTEGALGKFLEAATAGKIPRGSFLLVESLDRLSRQPVRKSLRLFLNLIDAGINIVTFGDGHVYKPDTTDTTGLMTDLIVSLTIMSRAHEESVTKSKRVGAAWAQKRMHADIRPLTARCPAWLRMSDDRKGYEIIPERSKIVRAIFEDAVAGMGSYVIARRLNRKGVHRFGNSTAWQNSFVAKLLSSRAVIGEFQPHKLLSDGRKRVPDGNAIKNYFPAIIADELFYRAEAARGQRKNLGGGRKGKFVSNLFSGIATCADCGAPMAFENKGLPPRGRTYLVCDGAKRGLDCVTIRWRYTDFEQSFLAFVEELDLKGIIQDDDKNKTEIDDAIDALIGESIALQKEMDQAYELFIGAGAGSEYIRDRIRQAAERRAEVERLRNQKEGERSSVLSLQRAFSESKEEIKNLIAHLQSAKGDELYKVRSQVSARIKSLISTIRVAPAGPVLDDGTRSPADRFFAVVFRNGRVEQYFPSDDDPFEIQQKNQTTL